MNSKKLRLSVKSLRNRITFMFIILSMLMAGLMILYWFKVLEPRLQDQAFSHARAMAQSQIQILSDALSQSKVNELYDNLIKAMDRILLLTDPFTGKPFILGIKIKLDYDSIRFDKGMADLKRGTTDAQASFITKLPVYSMTTKELLGIAWFYSNIQFFYQIRSDMLKRFFMGAMLVLMFLIGAWWFVSFLTSPLSILSRFLQTWNIDSQRSLPVLNPLASKEFIEFKTAIEEMIAKIKESTGILQRSEMRLKKAQQIGGMGSWEWDLKTNELIYSDETLHLFGIVKQKQGISYEEFFHFAHPEGKSFIKQSLEQAHENDDQISFENSIILPNGNERILYQNIEKLFGSDGRLQRIMGTVRDITELKQKENSLKQAYFDLQQTQAQLIETARLASIGQLSAGVAHELNQPLMVIRNITQLIKREQKKKTSNTESLDEQLILIERNTKRMMNIINHLRIFSRTSQPEFKSVEIHNVIDNCFLMIGEQLRLHNIKVLKDFFTKLPKVQGDENQLEQVFLNLLSNARDAIIMKMDLNPYKVEEGKIAIRTRLYPASIENDRGKDPLKKDSQNNHKIIEIIIEDNGTGIPSKDCQKIFDPFFTTKEVGKGTGLGLSISYGIINDHGGKIRLLKTDSKGTSFSIQLPV